MSIGLSLFLIAIIGFAISSRGFRKFLAVCGVIAALIVLAAIVNVAHDARQSAGYKPAYETLK
jgi:hypothetical protein